MCQLAKAIALQATLSALPLLFPPSFSCAVHFSPAARPARMLGQWPPGPPTSGTLASSHNWVITGPLLPKPRLKFPMKYLTKRKCSIDCLSGVAVPVWGTCKIQFPDTIVCNIAVQLNLKRIPPVRSACCWDHGFGTGEWDAQWEDRWHSRSQSASCRLTALPSLPTHLQGRVKEPAGQMGPESDSFK